jgi:hypothetical protein
MSLETAVIDTFSAEIETVEELRQASSLFGIEVLFEGLDRVDEAVREAEV